MTARSTRVATASAAQEYVEDFLMVSSFGFWAMLLGFAPVWALHCLV
jgi:hypothetical protein